MESKLVEDFLTGEAGKDARELLQLDPSSLEKAKELFHLHNGRLPSPREVETISPSPRLQKFAKDLSASMNDFLSRINDASASEAFATSSWDGMKKEVDKAWAAYQKHQDRKHNLRKPLEVFDNIAESLMSSSCLEFLLELVPSGEVYSSLLSGGLTLAYNTAVRKEKVREDILELFDSLSSRIDNVKQKMKLYSQDSDLQVKSEELYMAVCNCILHCTKWLDKKSSVESFKAFFQQSRYGKDIKDSRENMMKKVQEFEKTIKICFMREVREIHHNVEWMKGPIFVMFRMLVDFAKDFSRREAQHLEALAQQAPSPSPLIQMQFIPAPIMHQTVSTSQLRQLLAIEWQSPNPNISQDLAMTIDMLFNSDITTALQKVPSEFQQEQSGLLMANQTFNACLRGLESTFVVLRDEKSLQSTDSLSTLSYLCGLIAHTLYSPGLWPLTFFCGLHIVENATFKGAQGLMRAMALQLMKVIGETAFSVPGVDLAMVGQKLAMEDLDVICSVFSMLLDYIHAGVVYLLIDGAHHYGTEMRTADMCAVMRFLNRLVERMRANRRGLVLKVIVTSPTSRQQHTWDFKAETVELERQLLAGGHRGINV
ncbi:hypothetical protein Trisim1_010174 [Trichoderma cf. simile WF8]